MNCQFELTVICDNHAEKGLFSEHGLSFALRADGKNILFDTGNGETLIHIATKLGVISGYNRLTFCLYLFPVPPQKRDATSILLQYC